MKTWNAKQGEVEQKWWLVDATDKTIGRLATEIAMVLRGKHRPTFTPHVDTGDFVVVVNAEKLKFSGNKLAAKKYYHHTGYFGGIKEISAEELREKNPEKMIQLAVRGMLPKTKLGRKQLSKLKAYRGANHPHDAQKVEALNI